MIQFNLLPDVKIEYIKAQRSKRTIMMASVLAAGSTLLLFVLLFTMVNFAQKSHMKNLDSDIASKKKTLSSKQDLGKILTIQNQLNGLTDLHKKKPVTSRVFGYVQQLTPQNVSVSTFTVNYKDKTVKIEGAADSLASVNTFTDTLKFTNFVTEQTDSDGKVTTSTPALAFSDVVLSSFSVGKAGAQVKAKPAGFTITLKFKQEIFSGDKVAKLQIGNKITTRSETEKPTVFEDTGITPSTTADEGVN